MPAPKKVNPKDVSADLDDLLSPEAEQEFVFDEEPRVMQVSNTTSTDEVSEEEAAELAALQRALAKPIPEPAAPKYVPYDQLTPTQKKIRDLKDQVARRDAEIADKSPMQYDTTDGDAILVHVLEDGFTACGVVWYRGQEIRFVKGGEAYEQTLNRDGESWLDLDDYEQYERYGKKMFGIGNWPGKKWGDVSGLTDEAEIAQARQAAQREARRKAAAPIVRT